MKYTTFAISALFSTILSTALTSTALAAPLAPGGFVVLADEPGPTGALLVDQVISPFLGADIQGTVTSKVYSGDLDNPLGGLTFTYQIVSSLSSVHDMSRLSVGNYGGFQTDVSYNLAALPGVTPSVASRGTGPGDIVRFDFIGLPPGQVSTLLVVQTDAQAYAPTIASVINGGSAEFGSLAPVAIPEPATLALVGIGVLTLLGARNRRHR
jgi:hypothetical protein